MFKVGMYVKIKTKTINDVFGECIYKVTAVGLPCHHCKDKNLHGVEFLMLGGSGSAARYGLQIVDCGIAKWKLVQEGRMKIVDEETGKNYEKTASTSNPATKAVRIGSQELNY